METLLSVRPPQRSGVRLALGIVLIALGMATIFVPIPGAFLHLVIISILMGSGFLLLVPQNFRRFTFLGLLILFPGTGLALTLIPLSLGKPFSEMAIQEAALAFILLLVSYLTPMSLLVTFLLVLAFLSSELILAAHPLRDLGRSAVVRQLLTLIAGLQGPFLIVEDGEIKDEKKAGILRLLGGPGILVVRPCQAVVLERGGKITRIVGPGTVTLKPFERVRGVVPLNPRFLPVEPGDVLTADGVSLLHVSATVGYRFPQADLADGEEGDDEMSGVIKDSLCPARREDIVQMLKVTLAPNEWPRAVTSVAEIALRRVIGRHTLEGLFPITEETSAAILELIGSEATEECRRLTSGWGVEIIGMAVNTMTLPEEVADRVLAVWIADRQKQLSISQGEADAKRVRTFEEVRLAARQKAISEYINSLEEAWRKLPPDVAQRVERVLGWIMTHCAEDTAAGMRYISAMEKLMENPHAQVFIGQPPMVQSEHREPPETKATET